MYQGPFPAPNNTVFEGAYGFGKVTLPKFIRSIPGVYSLIDNPQKDLPPIMDFKFKKYNLPDKLYGEIPILANFFYDAFKRKNYTGGVILTGEPGAGKTELAKIICNKAIKDGLRVLDLSNTKLTKTYIKYLETLDDVVLFFDEFGKIIPSQEQDKLLTLFSNPVGVKRIIIITENEQFRISPFIRNRPGRIRYSKHFDKVPLSTVKDYLEDKNVDEDFYNEVLNLYRKMPRFAFDHLQAIVDEYLMFPNMEFKDILEILNLDFITGIKEINIDKVFINGTEVRIVEARPMALFNITEYSAEMRVKVEIPDDMLKDNELKKIITLLSSNGLYPGGGHNMYQPMISFNGNNDAQSQNQQQPNVMYADIVVNKSNIKEYVDDKIVFAKAYKTESEFILLEGSVKLSYEKNNQTRPY